ncbi:hypothetical protein EVA_06250 [gut metagenome]|uniref:Uncharacterized protein n=1 Tax=gut metagenome TaxID=749906 RepID=J9CZE7_9ZZZZ
MSGYWVIGNDIKPKNPKMTIKIDITVESTGRLINLSNFIFFFALNRALILFYKPV